MRNEEYLKIFSNFLKKNKAFGDFRNELNKNYGNNKSLSHYDLLGILKCEGYEEENPRKLAWNYIFSAFSWVRTMKGPTYWADLNTKWREELETL